MNAIRRLDALVPAKEFGRSKQRLAGVLDQRERALLARALLADVLATLAAVPAIRRTWVVSPSAAVRDFAADRGAAPLSEPPGAAGLNTALEAARAELLLQAEPPEALLVLPMDLPAIDGEAVGAFLEHGGSGPLVRLCPSPDGGTNALLLRPPDVIPFAFGRGSAAAHQREARRRGVAFEARSLAALQLDLDELSDLERCLAAPCGKHTAEVLRRLGIAERVSSAKRR